MVHQPGVGFSAYQILSLSLGNPGEVEHEELQTVSMLLWQHVHRLLKMDATILAVGDVYAAVSPGTTKKLLETYWGLLLDSKIRS